ncbi:MAG: glycosyltransferase family 39 protein [Anaerolineae bacterium]|nr:glycosyltransferase family 39 protein [Anaerolineae bacterium]
MSERLKRQIAWTAILPFVITLLALALRLYRLGAQSLWYDEGVSVYLARMSLPQLTAWTADDIQPPLYYYLLHFWLPLFGQSSSEFVVRFPSLFFGVLTVPLMYSIGQRLFGTMAGLLAAFLAAISPLYLWYSQETRMYTMLTFLCLLSSYLLLKALERRAPPYLPLWLAFVVANVAAAYTHYLAFFVMAFQGIYLVAWSWWMRGRERWLLLQGLAAFAAIALVYLPWVPFMLHRYQADVSYWQGTLKLDEVLRKTLISFGLGETVIEQVGAKLAVGYGVIVLAALAAIAFSKRNTGRKTLDILHPPSSTLFLLLYLLLPTALIIGLSYRVPKFSPRYLMLSSPPFILIIAGGLATLLQWERQKGLFAIRHSPFAIRYSLFAICLLFILTTSAYADYNNYFNIYFTKPDFRGAAQRIEESIGPDEAVILTSGHMYPVFAYYYRGRNWYPIPAERTLSTEHTLSFSVADDLNRALADKSGVWVVLWQDEVVDPNGFLLTMLEEEGQLLEAEDLWHVRLRHFALPENVHFSSQPAIQYPTEINFEGRIKLFGYDSRFTFHDSQLTIYWQAEQQLDDDYKVSLRLRDEEGHYWGRLDRRPAAYLYPTTRWKVGELLFGRYPLPILSGTPPGEYQLEVVLYSEARPEGLDVVDADGVAKGASAVIGTVTVPKGSLLQPPSREELGISQPLKADFGGRIALLGYELGRTAVQPGDSLYLMLFWQALADVGEDYSLTVALVDENGEVMGEERFSPLVWAYPTSRWVAGEVWRGQYDFTVPIEAQSGQDRLQIGLVDQSGQPLAEKVSLASLEIEPTERVFTAPETRYPSGANFEDLVTLLGADLDRATVEPGETLHLTLYWQAQTSMTKSYTVFTHLLDADSRIWAQQDGIPASGARPTTGWVPGEVIRDEVQLAVDPQAPPGDYVIEVGLYDAGDPALPRLAVLDEAGQPTDDKVLLAEVRVE